jgi:hypothetical protein
MNRTVDFTKYIYNISFKNEHVIYENYIKCTIKDYEFGSS